MIGVPWRLVVERAIQIARSGGSTYTHPRRPIAPFNPVPLCAQACRELGFTNSAMRDALTAKGNVVGSVDRQFDQDQAIAYLNAMLDMDEEASVHS